MAADPSVEVLDSVVKPAELRLEEPGGGQLSLVLTGDWTMNARLPSAAPLEQTIAGGTVRTLRFDTTDLGDWDSMLVTFVLGLAVRHGERLSVDESGLPEGVRQLLALARAVPTKVTHGEARKTPFLARIGDLALAGAKEARDLTAFLGEAALAFTNLARGRARFRYSDLFTFIEEAGPKALGIITLISFLVGLIMAFVGAVQLRQFGAQIYVANLVGLAMAREMAAMMTAIIMAGRTGAAYAAQLGTMQVNEEIDAFKTLGVPPMEFLVLPRMLALMLMLPLLTLYANIVGILGGAVVGVGMLDVGLTQYFNQTQIALRIGDFAVGLVKAAVFGILVAVAGCLRGMQSGRSAAAVGAAATSAVVTAIVLIIVADGVFAVVLDVLGI